MKYRFLLLHSKIELQKGISSANAYNSFIFVNNMPDILAQLNRQIYVRCLQPSTIDSIHTVFHQVLDMADDDDYLRSNPSSNVLRELKHSL